jgi:hypothetical protein
MMKNVYRALHEVPLFLSDFNETRIFLTGFRKILNVSNFQTIRPAGVEWFIADGQTEITKLTVANNAADERCRETEKTRFMLNNFVSENCAIYEIMWNNKVERVRPQERCDLHAG